ncbi:sensor histidine kinase [Streptomyces sp. AJS327]|uniref:sensor histidine kinase n=1 Tax=Streptomyces sp. AJS327 TaxID=2545265 RepID=UPI0015DFA938|nr:sensor histidine kinase [Streptomyces sp. AJS327]MBA0050122.1 sensor histidine kinase [Streptomyces sp. AJS327]
MSAEAVDGTARGGTPQPPGPAAGRSGAARREPYPGPPPPLPARPPGRDDRDRRGAPARRAGIQGALLAAVRGFGLALLAITVSPVLFVLTVVSVCLIPLGLGVFVTPAVLRLVRAHAELRRRLAHDWTGVTIPSAYRPLPADLRDGVTGQVERCIRLLKDPATWRDVVWLLVDATAGFLCALIPPGLLVYGIEGFVVFAGVWRVLQGGYWYGFVPVTGFGSAVICACLGSVLLLLCYRLSHHLVHAHFLLARAFIAPGREALLAERVERLYATRHDAVDSSASELRRIERDLHDGAQARLVAMGMSLGTIEALVEKDPARAKELIAQARQNSAEALTELRDLVRGIHPPVLAERGLPDAVRALALRMRTPVEVDVEVSARFEEPVESAAYFAVSEVLTNAVKHAQATRIWIDIHYSADEGGMLRIAVTDDGRGGADLTAGSGMAGIERRLGQFDGILAVSSPPGGPTLVTMEIPAVPVVRG